MINPKNKKDKLVVAAPEFAAEAARKGPILPYSSIQIYADLKDFEYSLKTLLQTKEADRPALLRQIQALFAHSKGQPADLLVTLSVRTAWSLFLEVRGVFIGRRRNLPPENRS